MFLFLEKIVFVAALFILLVVPALAQDALSYPDKQEARADLQGIVSEYTGPSPHEIVENLVKMACLRDEKQDKILAKDQEFNGALRKAYANAKLVSQIMMEYRGFEISSEAADVILDEKLRLKSKAAVDYAKQKEADELHTKIYSAVLQIAQGLGISDALRREQVIEAGMTRLKGLVGDEDSSNALKAITLWSAQVNVPKAVFSRSAWSMLEVQEKSEKLVQDTLQMDPVVGAIKQSLHKYNKHSKFALVGSKAMDTTISVASFTPTIAAPIAQLVAIGYLMATGGTEDSKLLKELYFDRRLESRCKRIREEVGLAINGYNNALMTNNSTLLAFTQNMVSTMAGEGSAHAVVGSNFLAVSKPGDEISCSQTHTAM